ncbi:hypothetical protein DSM104443_02900 [Usitatibacter rugosus]|uniref:WYL domain-containing protein n=1 Tax=Usitatibacter rugosus TaxID=2732067 RepID=A0A6M4H1U8_9PROT|nr:hypothetical protein [Usitatibacter rugosus]QJR11817.1 hypothetical protein DSM104443_02900 [Usitatibacter rugosus]
MNIADAIRDKRILRFSYGGSLRRVEPHVYGTDRLGQELLLAWQLGGGSESGTSVGWKTFRVPEMVAVTVTTDSFPGPRPAYKHGEHVMTKVIAEL